MDNIERIESAAKIELLYVLYEAKNWQIYLGSMGRWHENVKMIDKTVSFSDCVMELIKEGEI